MGRDREFDAMPMRERENWRQCEERERTCKSVIWEERRGRRWELVQSIEGLGWRSAIFKSVISAFYCVSALSTCPALHAAHAATLHESHSLSQGRTLSLSKNSKTFLSTHHSPLTTLQGGMTILGSGRCENFKSFASRFIGWERGPGSEGLKQVWKGLVWGTVGWFAETRVLLRWRTWSTRTKKEKDFRQIF